MEDIKQRFLEWVVGNMEYGYLYEDVTDDGDGIFQLTGEGEDVVGFIEQELSKAREEGAMNVFTKEEWFDLKLAMNDIFNSGNHAYEGISKKIQSELDKLSNKNKCSGK